MKKDFTNQKGIKLTIKHRSQVQFCEIEKITHITCESCISTINLIDSEKIVTGKLLNEFEKELEEFNFIRVNRTALVNLAHVKKYIGGSQRVLEMTNGNIVSVSRRNVFKLKNYRSFN